jgi:serine/threonine kinase PknH
VGVTQPPSSESSPPESTAPEGSDGPPSDERPGSRPTYDVHPNYTGPLRVPSAARDDEWRAESGVDHVPGTPSGAPPASAGSGEYPSGPPRPFEQHDEGPWSGGFAAPPPVIPRQRASRPKPGIPLRPIAIAVAAVAVVVLGGIGVWAFTSSDGGDAAPQSAAPTTPAMSEAAARDTLRGLLPAGYPDAACEPVATPKGALAKFGCEANTDPGGPPLATFILVDDDAALQKSFEDVIAASRVVNCPGSIQSPGPWRRNATPDKVAGTLFCGYQRDLPTLAWTDNQNRVVAAIRGDDKGPSLDALYRWWSSHS